MRKIGIIGAGFSGTMTAVQLIERHCVQPQSESDASLEIIIIDNPSSFNKGIAYKPYSETHLLNVTVGKMSAFPSKPDHFLEWVMEFDPANFSDKTHTANSFLPRKLYGEYLNSIWNNAQELAESKQIKLTKIDSTVVDLECSKFEVQLICENGLKLIVDDCVIATGNQLPRNPAITNRNFYSSPNYFRNPWSVEAVELENDNLPVLIVGNGLTMADTVLGLLEKGFKGQVFSISPNGLSMLPHELSEPQRTPLMSSFVHDRTLREWVNLVNNRIKECRKNGLSAEPEIDALRPYTQTIWRSLSDKEKAFFMSRLRHLWGVARHRMPLNIHEKLRQLRMDGKLTIIAGKLIDIQESSNGVAVHFFDKKQHQSKTVNVSRVINCTGPETDLSRLENSFLNMCFQKGIISQDLLKLGICTNIHTLQILDKNGIPHLHLFTLGSTLKGELWESTAVNELRTQAEKLADQLIRLIHSKPVELD